MITQIGIVAGEIWHYLDKKGSAKIDEVVKFLPYDKEVVLMSIGWLAREGHIVLTRDKKSLTAFLRHKKGRDKTGKKKGLALMTVLIIIFIITGLAAVVLYLMGNQAIIAEHKIKRSKAMYAARAGMISAMECLRRDNCPGCSPIASHLPCTYTLNNINGYDVNVKIDNDTSGASKYKIDVSVSYP